VAQGLRKQPIVVRVPHDEVRETFLEIHAGRDRLVTTLEVLSWSNKTPGDHGRDLYVKKQEEIRGSQVHLVEIDLLRGGVHTTAVRRDLAVAQTGAFDYHVCIHRFDNLEDFFIYAIRLGERLPVIDVPLLPGDGPAEVDLQALLDRCYDTGKYRNRVDYRSSPPAPVMSAEQLQLLDNVLRDQGLRQAPQNS
jgi:hypothetical protein